MTKFILAVLYFVSLAGNVFAKDIAVIIVNDFEKFVAVSLGKQEYIDNNLYQRLIFTSINNQTTADFGCYSRLNQYHSIFISETKQIVRKEVSALFVLNNHLNKQIEKKFLLGHDLPMDQLFSIKLVISCQSPE